MAGKHSAQHVSQHSAPRSSSRPERRSREVEEADEDYVPRRTREQYIQQENEYDYQSAREYSPRRQQAEQTWDEEPEYRPRREREPQPARQASKKQSSGGPGVFALIVRDILVAGLILCVFAAFHHVIPRMKDKGKSPEPVSVIQTPVPTATPEPTPEPEETPEPSGEEPEPTPTPEPDNRTEWQKKFEDKFTDEVVITDTSYTSPEVSITIEKHTFEESAYGPTVYYVADVYVASLESFKTYFANGKLTYYGYESPLSAFKNSGAILSINGDYADNQKEGFLVRNGELYYEEMSVFDICVLYYDGVMETYFPGEYDVQEILARGPVQSWKFGPALLDGNGNVLDSFNDITDGIEYENPRSAIGYYEPGHYCLLVADGRQNFSRGLKLDELASVFASLGCKSAYNLDGGASAVMVFNGKIVNSPSNGGRDCGDIVLVCEPQKAGEGEDG